MKNFTRDVEKFEQTINETHFPDISSPLNSTTVEEGELQQLLFWPETDPHELSGLDELSGEDALSWEGSFGDCGDRSRVVQENLDTDINRDNDRCSLVSSLGWLDEENSVSANSSGTASCHTSDSEFLESISPVLGFTETHNIELDLDEAPNVSASVSTESVHDSEGSNFRLNKYFSDKLANDVIENAPLRRGTRQRKGVVRFGATTTLE
jgi:hypothetical protein